MSDALTSVAFTVHMAYGVDAVKTDGTHLVEAAGEVRVMRGKGQIGFVAAPRMWEYIIADEASPSTDDEASNALAVLTVPGGRVLVKARSAFTVESGALEVLDDNGNTVALFAAGLWRGYGPANIFTNAS